MNELRKAAEMALEALETPWDILDDIDTASDMAKENDAWYRKRVEALQKKRWDTMITTDGYKLKGGPVEALRQALAEPANSTTDFVEPKASSQPEQKYATKVLADGTFVTEPLYTAPPKREWVGLTDEERFSKDWQETVARAEVELKAIS